MLARTTLPFQGVDGRSGIPTFMELALEFSNLGCPMGEVASLTRLPLYTSAPVLSSKKWGFSMKSQQIMREPQNSNFNSCNILYYISPPLSRENQYFQEFSIKIS